MGSQASCEQVSDVRALIASAPFTPGRNASLPNNSQQRRAEQTTTSRYIHGQTAGVVHFHCPLVAQENLAFLPPRRLMGEAGLHDTEGQRVDTGLPTPLLSRSQNWQQIPNPPNSHMPSGRATRDQKCRLARLVHLRPEPPGTVPARNAGSLTSPVQPATGAGPVHTQRPPARSGDTLPDAHQSLSAGPTPVGTSQSSLHAPPSGHR